VKPGRNSSANAEEQVSVRSPKGNEISKVSTASGEHAHPQIQGFEASSAVDAAVLATELARQALTKPSPSSKDFILRVNYDLSARTD
jgi:hypothetical protein